MVKLYYSKGWRPTVPFRGFPFRQQFCQCCICRAVLCKKHPGLTLPCLYVLALSIGGNQAIQASASCSYAVLFLLMPTALQELGKQDFTLLLSLEQKLTSARERNLEMLNHNLEIQRAGFWSGMAEITQQPYSQEKILPLRSESIQRVLKHMTPLPCCTLLLHQLLGFQTHICYPNSLPFPEWLPFQ